MPIIRPKLDDALDVAFAENTQSMILVMSPEALVDLRIDVYTHEGERMTDTYRDIQIEVDVKLVGLHEWKIVRGSAVDKYNKHCTKA